MAMLAEAQRAATRDNLAGLLAAVEDCLSTQERKTSAGRRLKALRESSPYTQEAVADHIGVTLRGYQKMEETGGVSYPNLVKLSKLFGVKITFFYDAEGSGDEDESQLDRIEKALEGLTSQVSALMTQVDELRQSLPGPVGEQVRRPA